MKGKCLIKKRKEWIEVVFRFSFDASKKKRKKGKTMGKSVSPEDMDEMHLLAVHGWHPVDIARKFATHDTTVRKFFKTWGICYKGRARQEV